jgi:predicted Zn finger-like uncharacterized protein
MDVRCERCRAQYVFDDDQVTPAGLAVQCTNCGHLFRVKKKELVVTVAVKPEEIEGTPLPASAVAHRPAPDHREPVREWRLRQASGGVFTFRELTTLQKWIIERKVGRDDEISVSGEQWKRLGDIGELSSFFQVVEAAERGRAMTPAGIPAVPAFGIPGPPPVPPPFPPPPSGYPPPSFAMPPASAQRPAEWRPAAQPPPAARPGAAGADPVDDEAATVDVELGDLGPARRGRGARIAVLLVALAAAAGAAAYAFAPQLFREPKKAAPAPTPVVAEAKPQESPPPAEPPPAPVAAPEPVAERPIEPPPAPVAAPPKAAAPQGPKALLARAGRLREKGDYAAALDLYGRVASEDPENAEALTGRGLCYLDLERYAPAEASFEAALQVDPRQADALLGLAETYRWQGKKADAIRYYERYLASYPQGEEAQVARNALEELRK